ncbi:MULTISPECIES: hypothetical protein [Staphylococcus]|uniref:Lipoprotein n=1 Tax=Staphylococcus schleiferi TaxID=1295 RepID=A0A7Z7VY33_STASC|nr:MULTISPECIES: hypothetical protein [Staphylococcus]QGS46665.1 hypothetical protein FOB90_08225 [Mammaliicoccus fleurettii]EPD49888.1 hypothetical protein HMPREF1208_01424 [Staphylococcus sp. HGB0015]MBF1993265.1 hypothetical protein [Staphylococcus schleiferi]MBF2038744.1 hypothetical protein [Staphylococcus schleiferi]MBF2100687.1 hypothetical protein [Staphylococcus schleiferi]
MKKLITTCITLLVILTGCSEDNHQKEEKANKAEPQTSEPATQEKETTTDQQQSSKKEVPKDKKEVAQSLSESDKEHHEKVQQEKKDETKPQSEPKPSDLDRVDLKTKIALAFFVEDAARYTITATEINQGTYEHVGAAGTESRTVNHLQVTPTIQVPNAPEGMQFYMVSPPKGNFVTIVGVSPNTLFIGGTQSAFIDYQMLLSSGKAMPLLPLYEAHHNDPRLHNITTKMSISQ